MEITAYIWSACVLYLSIVLLLVAPSWVGGRRIAGRLLGHRLSPVTWAVRVRARGRAERARQLLRDAGARDVDLPSAERLESLLAGRRLALLGVGLVWGPLVVLWLAGLELSLHAGHPRFLGFAVVWGCISIPVLLAEIDRRAAARAVPLEWTAYAAVAALESFTGNPSQRRGLTLASVISESINEFCATLERQALHEPRRADPVLRRRIRESAHLIVRNVQDTKGRLLHGDVSARSDLAEILRSVLVHTTIPSNDPRASVRLIGDGVLNEDPQWQRETPPASTGLGVAAHIGLAGLLAGAGVAMTMVKLPDAVIAVVVPVLSTAGALVLSRLRIPVRKPFDSEPVLQTAEGAGQGASAPSAAAASADAGSAS